MLSGRRQKLQEFSSRLQKMLKADYSKCWSYIQDSFAMCQLLPDCSRTFVPSVPIELKRKNIQVLKQLFPEIEFFFLTGINDKIPFQLTIISPEEGARLQQALQAKKTEEEAEKALKKKREEMMLKTRNFKLLEKIPLNQPSPLNVRMFNE